jgi:hypothetical protein
VKTNHLPGQARDKRIQGPLFQHDGISAGYKLGEHCDWFKHDNYEDATRIVTIIKPADGLLKNPKPPGTIIEQLAEEVDMFPSLLVSQWLSPLCCLVSSLCSSDSDGT